MILTTQRLRHFIFLLLISLLPSWGMAAEGIADPARDVDELPTHYPDILRLYKMEFPGQPAVWYEFWAHITEEGLKEVVPGVMKELRLPETHEQDYLGTMYLMADADNRQGLGVMKLFSDLIEQGLLKADSSFVRRLRPIMEEIDRKGRARMAELDKRIAEEKQKQAEEKQKQEQYRKLTEMLKAFQNRK